MKNSQGVLTRAEYVWCWLRSRKVSVIALALLLLLLVPQSSNSQFIPSPCCALLSAGLSSVTNAISNVVGHALNTIGLSLSSIESFQRSIVWPRDLIDEARAFVGSVRGTFNQVRDIGQISVASATLPIPQRFENRLLSGDAGPCRRKVHRSWIDSVGIFDSIPRRPQHVRCLCGLHRQ